jgi:hypothetical protein
MLSAPVGWIDVLGAAVAGEPAAKMGAATAVAAIKSAAPKWLFDLVPGRSRDVRQSAGT